MFVCESAFLFVAVCACVCVNVSERVRERERYRTVSPCEGKGTEVAKEDKRTYKSVNVTGSTVN